MENFKTAFDILLLAITSIATLAVFDPKIEEKFKRFVHWRHRNPRCRKAMNCIIVLFFTFYAVCAFYIPYQQEKTHHEETKDLMSQLQRDIELNNAVEEDLLTNSSPAATVFSLIERSYALTPVDVEKPIDLVSAEREFTTRKLQLGLEQKTNEMYIRIQQQLQQQQLQQFLTGPVLGPYQSRMDTFPATLTSPIFDYAVTKLKESLKTIAAANGDVLWQNYRGIPNPILRSDITNSLMQLKGNTNWSFGIGILAKFTGNVTSGTLQTTLLITNQDNSFTIDYIFPTQPSVMLHKWMDASVNVQLNCSGAQFCNVSCTTNNYQTSVREALAQLIGATKDKYPLEVR